MDLWRSGLLRRSPLVQFFFLRIVPECVTVTGAKWNVRVGRLGGKHVLVLQAGSGRVRSEPRSSRESEGRGLVAGERDHHRHIHASSVTRMSLNYGLPLRLLVNLFLICYFHNVCKSHCTMHIASMVEHMNSFSFKLQMALASTKTAWLRYVTCFTISFCVFVVDCMRTLSSSIGYRRHNATGAGRSEMPRRCVVPNSYQEMYFPPPTQQIVPWNVNQT